MKNSHPAADLVAINRLIDRLSLRAVSAGQADTDDQTINHLSLRAIGGKPMTNKQLALRMM